MAGFYANNNTYFSDSVIPKTVLKYVNNTRRRLFVNRLDLLPDVYLAKYGSITILKNGVEEYESKREAAKSNTARRYLQYSVADRIKSLDRYESLEIVLSQTKMNSTIKLALALEMDWTAAPIPAANIIRDPITLGTISEALVLANNVIYDQTQKEHHNLPFDIKQYTKMVITITARALTDPQLLSNDLHSIPTAWVEFVEGSYRGTTEALRRLDSLPTSYRRGRSRSGSIYWRYPGSAVFHFRRADGTIFIPSDHSGSYRALSASWNLNNPGKNHNDYSLTFAAPSIFSFDVRYEYLIQIYRYGYHVSSRPTGKSYFRYTWDGRRIIATQTQEIQILGHDEPDFSDAPTVIMTIADAPHTELTRAFKTNKKYVRLVSTVAYNIVESRYYENETVGSSDTIQGLIPETGTDPYAGLAAFYNSLPSQGSLYLPHRVMGYHNLTFPSNAPDRVRNFQNTVHTTRSDISEFEITQFVRTPADLQIVTLALQTRGADGQWFTLIEDIGTIKSNGKTVLTLSSDDFERNVVWVRGPDTMRLVATATQAITLSIAAALTN